jgi:hypothetical protein
VKTKSDAPAFRFIVEPGPKLVPASAYDAERLDTFKVGRVLRFTPVEESDRKDIRRWWAILNRVVKDANTPWRTAAQASEAIKLALGIVEYGKTIHNNYMQWPKSLKELDDEELAQAVRDMGVIIHRMTGVDPLDWSREAPDVGDDEPRDNTQQSSEPSAVLAPDEGGVLDDTPTDAAPTLSSRHLETKAEIVAKFLALAVPKEGTTVVHSRESLEMAKDMWKQEITSGDYGAAESELLKLLVTTVKTVDDVIRGRKPFDDAKTYLEGLAR